jgi:hypothetical protein
MQAHANKANPGTAAQLRVAYEEEEEQAMPSFSVLSLCNWLAK